MSDENRVEQVVRSRQTLAINRDREAAHKTRAQDEVHPPVHGEDADKPWTAPQNLDAPPPRSGMVQRWVRTATGAADDPNNVYKAIRDGWTPRMADTVTDGFDVPTISHGKHAGVIGVHGMILCEAPAKLMNQRKQYYESQTLRQTQAIARDLAKESNPSMPLHQQRESTVQTGRVPTVQQDEG